MIQIKWALATLLFLWGCATPPSNKPLNIDDVDTLAYYFSGELKPFSTTFLDCVTSKPLELYDPSGQINSQRKKLIGSSPRSLFLSFRGYISADNKVVVTNYLGLNRTKECNGVNLCRKYSSSGDTLILLSDYSCVISQKGTKTYHGKWARSFNNEGALIINKKVYPFIINYGTENSEYDIVLAFKRLNNKKINFVTEF